MTKNKALKLFSGPVVSRITSAALCAYFAAEAFSRTGSYLQAFNSAVLFSAILMLGKASYIGGGAKVKDRNMSKKDEALKLALNLCVLAKIQGSQSDRDAMLDEAIAHIREALAEQPVQQQEPKKRHDVVYHGNARSP